MSIVKAIYYMVPAEEATETRFPQFSRSLALSCLETMQAKGHPVVEVPIDRIQYEGGMTQTRIFVHAAKAAAVLRIAEPGTNEAIICGYIMNEAYEMIQGKKVPGFLPESEGMKQLEREAREMMRPRPFIRRSLARPSNPDWQSREPAGLSPARPIVEIKPSYKLSDFQRKHIHTVLADAGFEAVFKGVKDES